MSGLGNLFDLMKNAKQMMEKAKTAQAELAKRTAEGVAGAGLVQATISGTGDLIGLKLDKSIITPDDPEMLVDLILAAVADARKKVNALRGDALKDVAGGVDLSAFGLDVNNLP